MTPGRPVFDSVIERVEKGEAHGIIAWAPDRLARNSIDGGRVIYLLDTGKLKDLKFATFTFENTPSGKFMLSILFGQSKYYSDALSENVKRGIRTKLQNGWLPGKAPLGYVNDSLTHTIIPDPNRFLLVRELWELTLTGVHTLKAIRETMTARGLRTPQHKKQGGGPPSLSTIYNLLQNPFYAGVIPWRGQLHAGKHQAMITMDEWNAVQARLTQPIQARPKALSFAYTGLITCGECGFAITAEEKTNRRYGYRYTYYHCSKRRLDYRCRQRSVEIEELERQIESFLESLTIAPQLHECMHEILRSVHADAGRLADAEAAAIAGALHRNETARRNLTKLRIAEQIGEEEFTRERGELDRERFTLSDRAARVRAHDRFEPLESYLLFSIRALEWFRRGDDEARRLILEIAGSNHRLHDQKLSIDAAKPLRLLSKATTKFQWLGVVRDVRTFSDDPDTRQRLAKLRILLKKVGADLFGLAA